MIKVLIIGKKSFIGSNLYIYLKKKIYVKKISFDEIKRKNSIFFKNFSHIINCSVNPNYIKLRYNAKFDNDLKIVKKIKNINTKYIFLVQEKYIDQNLILKRIIIYFQFLIMQRIN